MPGPVDDARSAPVVVVLGASRDPGKYGHRSVVAHERAGYRVLPINPHATEIAGVPAFARLADLPPGPVDRVSVYLPPEVTLQLLPEIARLKPREVWLNPGAEDQALLSQAHALGLTVVEACSIVDANLRPVPRR
ncbi:MAG: CoA-binding protein [Planctomycetaceae bacterium]